MWVEKRGNKYKYVERYTDKYTELEQRVSVVLQSNSAQANNKAKQILAEKIQIELNRISNDNATFEEVYDKWYTPHLKNLRSSSKVSARSIRKLIFENFKIKALMRNIDTRILQDFFDGLDYSNEYMSALKSTMNMVFKYAKKNEYIRENPIVDVELNLKAKTENEFEKVANKFLELDQAEAIIAELYRIPSTYRQARLAEFMYLTGTRIGEATILKPENFNFEDGYVEITGSLDRTKGGYKNAKKGPTKTPRGNRRIYITPRCIELVERSIEENELTKLERSKYQDKGYIFVTKNGVPVQDNSFNASLKRAGERIGLGYKTLSSHIFRHSHVSFLAEKRIPKQAIMDRIGHSDSRVTDQIYTHVTRNMKTDIIDQLIENGL